MYHVHTHARQPTTSHRFTHTNPQTYRYRMQQHHLNAPSRCRIRSRPQRQIARARPSFAEHDALPDQYSKIRSTVHAIPSSYLSHCVSEQQQPTIKGRGVRGARETPGCSTPTQSTQHCHTSFHGEKTPSATPKPKRRGDDGSNHSHASHQHLSSAAAADEVRFGCRDCQFRFRFAGSGNGSGGTGRHPRIHTRRPNGERTRTTKDLHVDSQETQTQFIFPCAPKLTVAECDNFPLDRPSRDT
ncbi:hypothetical protein IWX50DRAFT_143581 [Phyllosticta citricarpa]